MLAYELFQNNKNSTKNNPKKQFPFKKIFYKNNKIIIDEKGLEEYGESESPKDTKQLQDWLQMPLNTIDIQSLNLPDCRTGTASANPYVEVYGYLQTNRSLETKLILSMGKKPERIIHTLDLTNDKIKNNNYNGIITLKLDKKNYLLNSNPLFSEYVASGLVDEYGTLNTKVYENIAQKFLEFATERKPEFKKFGIISFRIYILPDDSIIEFKKQIKKDSSKQISFIDYFGNDVSEYASTPTKTAKFLSYDDKAFTINCMQKESFYKNLGIGDASKEKISVDPSQTFRINRLDWTFIDISNPNSKFTKTKKGILTQMYENYHIFSKGKEATTMTQLKVICIRTNQAKQELLIDENLTMGKMKNMFSNIKDIPRLCLEGALIDDSNKKNPIWDTYLYVVKNFIAGNKIPKNYLLSHFNKMLKQKRYDWIKLKDKSEQKAFFLKSDFCLKYLSASDNA